MAEPIEEAVVGISPDFTGFAQEFDTKLKAATGKAKVTVPGHVNFTTKQIRDNLNTALARIKTPTIQGEVRFTTKQIRDNLLEAIARVKAPKIQIDAQIKIAAAELAKIEAITKDRTVRIRYRTTVTGRQPRGEGRTRGGAGGGGPGLAGGAAGAAGAAAGAIGALSNVGKAAAGATEGVIGLLSGLSRLTGLFSGVVQGASKLGQVFASMGASASAAGPIAIAIIAALAVALAGLVVAALSVTAALAQAAVGMVALAGVAVGLVAVIGVGLYGAFSRTTAVIEAFATAQDQAKRALITGDYEAAANAVREYQRQFSELTPAAQSFTNFVNAGLKPALKIFQQTAESAFLPGIQGALTNIMTIAPTFLSLIDQIGTKFGELAQTITGVFTNIQGQSDLGRLFAGFLATMDSLKTVVSSFGAALLTVLSAAAPALSRLVDWIGRVGEEFNAWIQSLDQSGQLETFFNQAADAAIAFGELAVEAVKAVFNIFVALAPIGVFIVKMFTAMLKSFNAFASSAAGRLIIFSTAVVLLTALAVVAGTLAVLVFALVAPFIAVGAAIAAVAFGIVKLLKLAAGLAEKLPAALRPDWFIGLADGLDEGMNQITGALSGAKDSIANTFDTSGGDAFQKKLEEIMGGLKDLGKEKKAFLTPEQRQALLGQAFQELERFKDLQKDVTKAQDDLKDTIASTARANVMAARRVADAQDGIVNASRRVKEAQQGVVDAQLRVRDAYKKVTDAQKDLIRAREEATRKLRDQPDTEESLKIALAEAELTELQTRGLNEQNLTRRRAVLDAKNAREDLSDFQADRISKIAQDPGVISATQAVEDARKGVKDAQKDVVTAKQVVKDAEKDLARAHRDLSDAYYDQTQTYKNGEKARKDAREAVETANTALGKQKTKLQQVTTELRINTTELEIMKKTADKLADTYDVNIKLNKGDVDKNLLTTMEHLEAIKLLAVPENANKSAQQLLAMAKANIAAAQSFTKPRPGESQSAFDARMRKGKAKGGGIFGRGTATSDSIPTMLSQGEHVWTAAEVNAVGGHKAMERLRKSFIHRATGGGIDLDAILNEERLLSQAQDALASALAGGLPGGPIGPATPFAPGEGIIGAMQDFANRQKGKRYLWSAVGPNKYDCSGLVGNLYAMATGRKMYQRYFSTSGMPLKGWERGKGKMSIYLGPGHTAANIGGLHAEAYGGNGTPLAIGHVGTPLSYYTSTWHLPGLATGGSLALRNNKKLRQLSFMARGWPEPVVADNGTVLPPRSRTLVENRTSKHEMVGFPQGMSRADKIELAQLIAQALHTKPTIVEMDKKVIAETSDEATAQFFRGGSYA